MKISNFLKKERADLNGFISNSLLIVSSILLNTSEILSMSYPQISADLKSAMLFTSALAVPTFIASLNRPNGFYRGLFTPGANWRVVSNVMLAVGLVCDPLKEYFNANPPFNSAPNVILQSLGLIGSFGAEIVDEVD